MSDSQPSDDITAARAELEAARVLLNGPVDLRSEAVDHVVAACSLLARTEHAELAAAATAQLAEASGTSALRRCIAELSQHIGRHQSVPSSATRSMGRPLLAVVVLVMALPFVLTLAWVGVQGANKPWRGRYFPTAELTGTALERDDRDLRFRWAGKRPPLPTLPIAGYSVSWDTCLSSQGGAAAFQLISTSQAQFMIDGTVVLEAMADGQTVARGKELELATGVHHLRVTLRDAQAATTIALVASFGDEAPTRIPSAMLSSPGTGASPCSSL